LKTKIISLESHDDLISVRDRLSWAKTPRILLVWPKYEKVTLRLLDLKVLQRHADSLGAQLGLVTRRMNVRRDAEALGIPVFDSTASAQKEAWKPRAPRNRRIPPPPRRNLRALRDEIRGTDAAWQATLPGRLAAFTAGVVAVLALASLFVPKAAVTLHPEAQILSVTIPVNASPSFAAVSLSGNVPAQTINVTMNREISMPVTSQINVPKSKAKGAAQFINLGEAEVFIPAGTAVSTESLVHFITLNDVRLPGGVGETVEVQIEALDGGSKGNVDADRIRFLEGPLGLSAAVTNSEPTTGGTDARMIGAGSEIREALRQDLLAELRNAAEDQIRASIGADDLLLPGLEILEIQREEFIPPPGEPGTTLTLSMQAEFSGRYILAEDLKRLAITPLNASVPPGFFPVGDWTFDLLDAPVTGADGVTRFRLRAKQTALRSVDVIRALELIRGREPREARSALMTRFSLREPPQITLTPSWWKWLPLIPFNISVEVK
jgi:hypothetical protein